jgi:hypothetical protein
MADPYDITLEGMQEYNEWLKGRPEAIRKMGEKFPPWQLYLLTTTNHIVVLYSINEGEEITFTVAVTRQYNPFISFERRVFGIKPEDLVPISQREWEETFKPMRDKMQPYEPKKSN